MSAGNTVKDGTGNSYWLLLDADANLYVRMKKMDSHTISFISASGNIKGVAPGILYSLIISYIGVTAGDYISIKNAGAGGTEYIRVVFPDANGTIVINPAVPMAFANNIYADYNLSGGAAYVTGVYD